MEASQHRAQRRHASDLRPSRRLPIGAEVLPSEGVHFRVWASRRHQVEVVLEGGPGHHPGAEPISVALEPAGDGYFSGLVPEASAGTLYRYRLDGGTESYPDVASRFQPHGPHGPSQVIDPGAFQWHDQGWPGVPLEGPDGNFLAQFSPEYFTDRYTTDWGQAINYEDEHAGPVREFFLANAGYWIEEFHFDGLRLDATQNIYDTSADHILAAITRRVRHVAHGRATLLVAENEPQHTKWVRPPEPSPGCYMALKALLLLGPGTPMLFQGQEFAASSPFFFFADFTGELGRLTRQGRTAFLSQFPSLAQPDMQAHLSDPTDPETFACSKLDLSERQHHAQIYALHRDLLRLRQTEPVFRSQRRGGMDGAVLGAETFVLRFFGAHGDDHLLVVNLGHALHLNPAPEPLLAPPEGMGWAILLSTEDPRYGGCGTAPLEDEDNWHLPGHAVVVLRPDTRQEREE